MDVTEFRVTSNLPVPVCNCRRRRFTARRTLRPVLSRLSDSDITVSDAETLPQIIVPESSRLRMILSAVAKMLRYCIGGIPVAVGFIGGVYSFYNAYQNSINSCEIVVWRRVPNDHN